MRAGCQTNSSGIENNYVQQESKKRKREQDGDPGPSGTEKDGHPSQKKIKLRQNEKAEILKRHGHPSGKKIELSAEEIEEILKKRNEQKKARTKERKKKYDEQKRENKKDQLNQDILTQLNHMKSALDLSESHLTLAKKYVDQVAQKNYLLLTMKREPVVGCIMYQVCQQQQVPRCWKDVSIVSGVPKGKLLKTRRCLYDLLGQEYREHEHNSSLNYLPRFSKRLNLSESTIEAVCYVLKRWEDVYCSEAGQYPQTKCAASILLISQVQAEKMDLKTVSKACYVNYVTVEECLKKMYQRASELCPLGFEFHTLVDPALRSS